MTFLRKIGAVAAIAMGLTTATIASAQTSYYVGGGLAYTDAVTTSNLNPASTSSGDLFGLGITIGLRSDTGSMFYGAEIDGEVSVSGEIRNDSSTNTCADGADWARYCDQTATVRLRGIVGTDISGYEVFGSLGYGLMTGDAAVDTFATDTGVSGGVTYGIGMQTQFGSGLVRFEVIRDEFTTTIVSPQGYNPTWQATTVKASYIYQF